MTYIFWQGLASQKEHCYHSPMCQVGLQAPRTFQNRQIGWSSGLSVGASTPVQNPQCFPCFLAWALSWKPDLRTSSRTPSSSRNWRPRRVWSSGGLGLQENSWKAPIPFFWRGYPPSEATWEPAGNLVHAQDLVNRFHQRYPNKPTPSGRCRLRRG